MRMHIYFYPTATTVNIPVGFMPQGYSQGALEFFNANATNKYFYFLFNAMLKQKCRYAMWESKYVMHC